ncbi:MAG: 1-acyl-sn-glycerol-3-phosphate acyltransferase [Verrucomicrobiales bacterium]|nr:1-acyl-sn-glycerol-3-phosphate acyltransferase [Verrucomicrobiales bacterium]
MRFLVQTFFKYFFLPIIWLNYRIRRTGVGFVPREGGVLLLSNHVSYLDSFILYLSSPRPVRFVVLESYTKVKAIGWFLRLFGAIPIRPERAKEAISRTVDALEQGDVVCLFPEGGLTRLGVLIEFKKGFELIVRKSGAPVVPVYMDGLFNSIFSFERGRYFKKKPNGTKCPLQVAFGRPIPPEEAKVERVREAVMEQSVEAFGLRRELRQPLEKQLIRALKKGRRKSFLVEHGKKGPRNWSRAYTLGLSVAVARRWMNQPPDDSDRIGILLPPGPMSVAVNFGLFLAGKTPVNLPFSMDQQATEEVARSIAPLGIKTVITSRAFMPHLMDFWCGDEGVFIDLNSMMSASTVTILERWRAIWEPAAMTIWRLDLNRRSLDREAVGMIPRPGEAPVILRSEQLQRNAMQVAAAHFFQRDEILFSEESLSSPEGMMLGCWTPALHRGKVISRSLALRDSFEALEHSILSEEVTLVAGRGSWYEQIKEPLSIRSLRYGIVYGAVNHWQVKDWEETLDLPLARAWSWKGRIVTMSRPDPDNPDKPHHAYQRGRDPMSIGRILPGIAMKREGEQVFFRFAPIGEQEMDGKWVEGPFEVSEDPDGLLFLRDVDPR